MSEFFRKSKLGSQSRQLVDVCNEIIEVYQADGYTLTLRQLYYQLVTKNIIPNLDSEYAKLSRVIKEGRMGGLIAWGAIEDRLRKPQTPYTNTSVEDALSDALHQYRLPRQQGQTTYVEVWVEKDALSSVLSRVTSKYGIPLLVNRGYGSVTAMYDAYRRMKPHIELGCSVEILYLGDHDPSGLDMIRDVRDRILEMLYNINGEKCIAAKHGVDYMNNDTVADIMQELSADDMYWNDPNIRDKPTETDPTDCNYYWDSGNAWIKSHFQVTAIALTMSQIKTHQPPPNTAKLSDSRAQKYVQQFGKSSWEVDALEPRILHQLLDTAIQDTIDLDTFNGVLAREAADRRTLRHLIGEV